MRIFFKILAAPFVLVLAILAPVVLFLFSYAKVFLEIVSGLAVLLAVVLFVIGQTTGGIVFIVIAFLISPVGIPAIAKWLIDKLDDLNDALKCFITT